MGTLGISLGSVVGVRVIGRVVEGRLVGRLVEGRDVDGRGVGKSDGT